MPAYDNVQLPSGPSPASYAPKPIDFSWLAQLPQDYQQGALAGQEREQYARTRAIQTALPNGIDEFKDPSKPGGYDYAGLVNRLVKVAGPQGAGLANDVIGAAYGSQITGLKGNVAQSEFGAQPQGPAGAAPQQATPQAQDQGGDVPPNTLRGMVQASVLPQDAARFEQAFGQSLGVGPLDPLTPDQMRLLQGRLPQMRAQAQADQPEPTRQPGQHPMIAQGGGDQPSAPPPAGTQPPDQSQPPAQPGATSPGYQQAQMKADTLRQAANRAAFLGMKDRADLLNKQADAWDERAKQDPQYLASVEGAKAVVAGDVKRGQNAYAGITAAANTYEQQEKPMLQMANSVLNNPAMYSGFGSKVSYNWNKIKDAFGLDPQRASALQAMLQKITATTVLGDVNQQKFEVQEAGQNGGRIFAQQVDLVTKAAPDLENTVYGNRALIAMKMRTGEAASQVAQMARNYLAQGHAYLDQGFDQQLSNYLKAHPVFTPQEQADPRILGAPQAPPTIATVQDADAWKSSMGIKSGEPYRTPDGRIKYAK